MRILLILGIIGSLSVTPVKQPVYDLGFIPVRCCNPLEAFR